MINEDVPEVEPGEISTGMAFGSMEAYKDHLREYPVDSQKCAWQVNARKLPKKEDKTVTVRDCNMEHTCKNPNEDYSRKCNVKFVAKSLLKMMDVGSPVDKEDDIAKKIIRPQLQTDIPCWVANNARKLVLAERNGSFESSYTKAPQLFIAATSLNPNSIGPPVGSNPKKKGVRMECSVNGDEFCITTAPTKKMRKALSAPTTATTSASKKSVDVPPLSKGKTTSPSSSTAADVSAKRKVPHPYTSSTPSTACFNQTYNGVVNISSQTINITEPSSKRVRKPNSIYQ
ncbi:hypothetical protein MKW98_017218 [Papaver atlanticum]|uniref:Uncharacterized protein n=1 Tax=Papaver atlanticum TaxID=357466 RepID=A0AAD4SPE9_9MAGN|nr:hypothetical protein MKW98_017218 [Papaver atlanticum]